MKIIVLALLIISLVSFSFGHTVVSMAEDLGTTNLVPVDACPDQDIWVYIEHDHDGRHPTCTVIVHIPKRSLKADFQNCPAEDIKVLGEGRIGFGLFVGFHVLTLKKGYLNKATNYTTRPPKDIKVPENNINTWHVGIIRDY